MNECRAKRKNVFSKLVTVGVVSTALLLSYAGLASAKAKYKEIDVKNGGSVKGHVFWKGDIPKLPPVTVFKHMDTCGQTTLNPALIIDPNSKAVKFTAVWIAGIKKGKKIDVGELERDNQQVLHAGRDANQRPESLLCNFEEHVFAFVRTKKMGFYNMEPLIHNPHGFKDNGFNSQGGGATLFNVALPDRNTLVKKTLRRVKGIERFQCDTHVHMNAWMIGFDQPYFDVTNKKGEFEITNIPPGKYPLIFWHEGFNIKKFAPDNRPIYDNPHIIKKMIEIKPGETIEVNVEMPVRQVKINYIQAKRTVEGH